MATAFEQILELVGPLDDSPGQSTARDRFRAYLGTSVTTVGALRDYIEVCLRTSGAQYNRALQDLVNHCGRLLGFNVEFGRYQGVTNDIGHDGLWHSAKGFCIAVEVKTTDSFSISTATLVGYVDQLISAKRIPDWDHALGLYIVGRMDAKLSQLTNSIVAEKRTAQLRITSIGSLLSLAELLEESDVTHDDILGLIRPTGPVVDDVVSIIARVTSQVVDEPPIKPHVEPGAVVPATPGVVVAEHLFLMTPVSDDEEAEAPATIRKLLTQGWYVFGDRTPGRKRLKGGDRICFYQTGVGVVAEATVESAPENKQIPGVRHPERYPWAFPVSGVRYFFDTPVVIDAALRAKLDAFRERDPNKAWAWFVQATRLLSEHDFKILVGGT